MVASLPVPDFDPEAVAASYHATLEARRDEMIGLLRDLVDRDTPSARKDLLDAAMARVEAECRAAGAAVRRVPQAHAGDHLVASWPARRDPSPRILVLSHLDTVFPEGEAGRRPFHDDGERLTGPGVFDMKGGLVQALAAIRAVLEGPAAGAATIVLAVTSDEETGSRTSRPLIEELARESDVVLVPEPAAGRALKTGRKGVGMYTVRVTGRASHAGLDPERGRSAVLELAHQIVALHALADPERGTSVTVGVVRGGTARNVVPAEAEATVDLRVVSAEEAERLDAAIRSRSAVTDGTSVTVEGGVNRPPMERSAAAAGLFARAAAILRALGETPDEALVGGGSDGNFTAALGVPTLDGLGAVGGGAHALDEHVLRDAVVPRAALLAALIHDLSVRGLAAPG